MGQDFELNYANAVQGFCSQRCVPPTEALETNSMEIGLSHGRSHYTKTKNSKIGKIPGHSLYATFYLILFYYNAYVNSSIKKKVTVCNILFDTLLLQCLCK